MKQLALISMLMIIFSCKKEDDYIINETNQTQEQEQEAIKDIEFAENNFGDSFKAKFVGEIITVDGNRLKNALVTIDNISTYTDHNGVFIINDAFVYENFALIRVTKEGYIQGSKVIIPDQNGVNNIKITLLKKNVIGSVNTGTNSEISLPNGTKVTFGGEFIYNNGSSYSGQVDVVMHYIEPNQQSLFTQAPGMLYGMRENGSASAMETYGMISVSLFSPSGEPLNISETSPSNIEFPVSSTHQGTPNELPIWYFDEGVGYWKEQGIAVKLGNKYVAEVTHFTWWNCDLPFNAINFCYTLLDETNTNSLNNINVEIIRDNTGELIFYGTTNVNGVECGLLPANEEVTLNVYGNDECSDTIIYSETLGPYISNTSETITITNLPSNLQTTTLTGIMNTCSGVIITGYALVYESGESPYSNPELISITDGTINYTMTYCAGGNYSMLVLDLENNLISNEISFTPNSPITNIGEVNVCGNSIGGVYDGDILIESQNEIDVFGLFGYSEVTGNLNIGNSNNPVNDVTSIAPLSSLTTVGGSLTIHYTSLQSINGLENLSSVGDSFSLIGNDLLTSVTGFESLADLNDLFIAGNDLLTSVAGFNSISNITDISFYQNELLLSLNGFTNLNSIEVLSFYSNELLTSIEAFNNVNTANSIYIEDNNTLGSLQFLSNITTIGTLIISDNDSLLTLEGLENRNSLAQLTIRDNNSLTSITALSNLTSITYSQGASITNNNSLVSLDGLNNLTSLGGKLTISDNDSLTSLAAFDNLISFGGLISIENNDSLSTIDMFENANYSGIPSQNIIEIKYNPMLSSISGFNSLNEITGGLYIQSNTSLLSINGFNNLNTIPQLEIKSNNALTSLIGFNNLNIVNYDLSIANNLSLPNLNNFGNLTSIGGTLTIQSNQALMSIAGLNSVASFGDYIWIKNNPLLESLTGLENINSLNNLNIDNNDSLVSLSGLNSLNSLTGYLRVNNNDSLLSLSGLDNLLNVSSYISIGGYSSTSDSNPNPNLSDFCAITNLVTNGAYDSILIFNNAYNPTVQDIINGSCSQ